MRKMLVLAVVAAAGATLADGGAEDRAARGDSPWHFRVGPVMSPRVRVRIHYPSRISPLATLSLPGATSLSGKNGDVADGPSSGYADRTYADGYVRPDEGTDDPNSMTPGLTWNWGAKNVGSQYSGGKMQFRTDVSRWTESTSVHSYGGGGGADQDSDRDILLGLEAMGGWTFFANDTFDAAVDAGFRFYGSGNLKSGSRQGISVTTTRSEYRYVDSYDASGWSGAIPSGPYEGSESGPGRLIGALPTRSEELMGTTSSSETSHYHVHTKLNYSIWDLRLGPTLGWRVLDWLTLRGGVYGLLGLVDARLRTSVDAPSGYYSRKKSACEGVFGMAAGLSAQINFTDNFFLMGGVEYDWWSDAVSLQAGGADARIKLSDFSVSLAVGIEF